MHRPAETHLLEEIIAHESRLGGLAFTQMRRRLFTLPGDERFWVFFSRQNLLSLPPDSLVLFGMKDSRLGRGSKRPSLQREHDGDDGHSNVQSH